MRSCSVHQEAATLILLLYITRASLTPHYTLCLRVFVTVYARFSQISLGCVQVIGSELILFIQVIIFYGWMQIHPCIKLCINLKVQILVFSIIFGDFTNFLKLGFIDASEFFFSFQLLAFLMQRDRFVRFQRIL